MASIGSRLEKRYRGPGVSAALYSTVNSGVMVTPETSLTLAVAFACINVLSTDTAVLPFNVYKARKSGGRDLAYDHPVNELLSLAPSADHDSITLRQATMGHCNGWGNGYQEIVRDDRGRPLELVPLDPRWSETQPFRAKSGRLLYTIHGAREEPKALPARDILHIAGLGWDGLIGYSPVAMCRQAIGLGIAAEMFGASFFGNGSHGSGAIKLKKNLTPTSRENLRQSIERAHATPANANRLMILEEGMEWEQTSINPDDAQFLETRKFQVLEVCRIYRVPPHKVMDYSQAHLANLEESNTDYLMTSLMPWLVKWEQQADRKLLTRAERMAGYTCRHDMNAFMRGNSTARGELYQILLNSGAASPTQIAGMEGLPPVEGGNIHLIPLNMTTVEQIEADKQAKAQPDKPVQTNDLPELP